MSEQRKYQEEGEVLSCECIAPDVYCMAITAPSIAKTAKPGQFVQVMPAKNPAQLLRMPFCVYDSDPERGIVEICYQVVGEGTQQLSTLTAGDFMSLVGPLGNGWAIDPEAKRVLLVSGGLGAAPLNLLARQLAANGTTIDLAMGAPTSKRLVCRDRLSKSVSASGGELFICTDDGSEGTHGFCTQESDRLLGERVYDCVFVCGPYPMERNAVKVPLTQDVPCQVSFERLMACGIGACLSCIVETKAGRKRCCADGPVFQASEVIWQ